MNTNQTGETIKQSVQDLREQGSETVNAIKNRAVDVAGEVKQQTSAMVNRTMDFIQARPITSLGIAVVAGYMSRTIFRLSFVAGTAMLLAKLVPMVSGKARA